MTFISVPRSRPRLIALLVGCALIGLASVACLPVGTPDECAGTVTTTVPVDCSTTTTAAPTTSAAPTTTAPTTTTTAPANPDDPRWNWVGNQTGPKVLVAGDSITYQSKAAIHAAFDDWRRFVMGLSGQHLSGADWYLTPFPSKQPDVVILEFGTNDTYSIYNDPTGATRDAWKAKMLYDAAMFPDACFAPVTIQSHRGANQPNAAIFNATNAELNAWLLATFPHTIDWDGYVAAQKALGVELLKAADDIHPIDPVGTTALAGLMRAAADTCLEP